MERIVKVGLGTRSDYVIRSGAQCKRGEREGEIRSKILLIHNSVSKKIAKRKLSIAFRLPRTRSEDTIVGSCIFRALRLVARTHVRRYQVGA